MAEENGYYRGLLQRAVVVKNMMEVPTESVVGNGYERMDADSIGIGNVVKSADLEQLRQVVTEKVVFRG